MQTTPGSARRLGRFHRAKRAPMAPSETFCRNVAHISVQTLDPRGPTTSSGEQNLDGEPSYIAGGLRAPTIDDDPTLQSNATISSKFTFMVAQPNPHEFVMPTREGLLRTDFIAEGKRLNAP